MKFQWTLLMGFTFALIVAIFSVINVDPVTVNYFFGEAKWPLILVILGSVLMGGLIVGLVGLYRMIVLQREVRALKKQNQALEMKQVEQSLPQEESLREIEDIH